MRVIFCVSNTSRQSGTSFCPFVSYLMLLGYCKAVFDVQNKLVATVAPTTLPHLHTGEGGGRHGYSKHHHDSGEAAGGTLPHLRHSDSVTSSSTANNAPSYATAPTPSGPMQSERSKRDQYGNRIPMTPSGWSLCPPACFPTCPSISLSLCLRPTLRPPVTSFVRLSECVYVVLIRFFQTH